ncbi:MAG TPA: cyclase family protein [Candidatus Binataceae bacterium]|nr:cyclase family protein [Candidatus Binataceae bacterium]
MGKTDFDKFPKFAQLPARPGAPADSNWGVFGDNDEAGCVNFLTAEGVVEAARLVQNGKIFRLDTPINYASPPLFNREPVHHTKKSFESYGLLGFDDVLDGYNTQEGSQWDGLGHVGNLRAQAYYNGVKDGEIRSSNKLGIHNWADRFVGRGLLLDAFTYRAAQGRPVNPLKNEVYSLGDLQGALEAQGAQIKPGTILLVRTGWMQAYLSSSDEQKRAMAPLDKLEACGIDPGRETVAWLWDNCVAAIGTDCPAVEPWPWDFKDDGALHYRTLSLLGLPLGEQFVLDQLAEDCAADRRYEFMLVSVPLHLRGGIASPPNAVAIK